MNKVILVNKTHPLKPNYLKKMELTTIKDIEKKDILIEEETYQSYLQLKDFLAQKNIMIGIIGAYRSLEEQQETYEQIKNEYGVEYANQIVAPVGASEHHTGLAIDLSIKIENKWIVANEKLLEQTEIFEKIHRHLGEYGFILRYPKEKEIITGYPYEPWHIRYVGKVVAKIIQKENLTLEEYLDNFSGIILVNKEAGMTSFDVIKELNHLFGIKRMGHTGTLDPLAEGVLVVTIGKATKVAELLTATEKEYQAGVLLGIKTDTFDITGTVQDSKPVSDDLNIEKAIQSYNKTYLQEVPIYSAVKVAGKKLYEYARKNEQVTLPKKEVTIKNMQLLTTDRNTFTFRCLVSKGCYIRSLIHDIGISLNTYGTMTKLTRTKQGKFAIEQTNTLKEIKEGRFNLYSIEESLNYKVVTVEQELEKKIITGQKIDNKYSVKDKVIFKNKQGKLLGIYEVVGDQLKTWKNFI